MVGGWWLVVGGWWLVVGGWWLVVGGWWLVVVAVTKTRKDGRQQLDQTQLFGAFGKNGGLCFKIQASTPSKNRFIGVTHSEAA